MSIKLISGPADGQTVAIDRAPFFLRIVQDSDGRIDALNELSDQIREDEVAHAYWCDEIIGRVHVCCRGGRGSGWRTIGTWRHLDEQPPQEVLRSNVAWAHWCDEQAAGREIAEVRSMLQKAHRERAVEATDHE